MKAVIINGSPRRKNWNTIMMLEEAGKGLQSKGFDVEIINLYQFDFKGCISCFLCKRKREIPIHLCQYKDEITPVFEKCIDADVLVFGSPNYFSYPTGELRCFLERLLFPITSYMVDDNKQRLMEFNKFIPTAFIFTMNANEKYYELSNYKTIFEANAQAANMLLGYSEVLCAFDTYQFKDYSKYKANMFDPVHKLERHEKEFPKDLRKAYELGERLANLALKNKKVN